MKLLSLVVCAASLLLASASSCYDRCYKRKRCEKRPVSSVEWCEEQCERLCGIHGVRDTEKLDRSVGVEDRRSLDTNSAKGTDGDDATSSGNLVSDTGANETQANPAPALIVWPKNATFDDIQTDNVTATNLVAGEVEVSGGLQSRSTISSRVYAEDIAASGFVTTDGLLVKQQASFRGQGLKANVIGSEKLQTDMATIDHLDGNSIHVTGTLIAGKVEISGVIADLAKEFTSLLQRVKDLEEKLEGTKECQE